MFKLSYQIVVNICATVVVLTAIMADIFPTYIILLATIAVIAGTVSMIAYFNRHYFNKEDENE